MVSSIAKSVASGDTATFSVPFPYLDRSHVEVTLDGVLVPYTWLSEGAITLGTVPKLGSLVRRQRKTPTIPLTTFKPGNLSSRDLNNGNLQALFVAQEAADLQEELRFGAWVSKGYAPGGSIVAGSPGQLAGFDSDSNLVGVDFNQEEFLGAVGEAKAAAEAAKGSQEVTLLLEGQASVSAVQAVEAGARAQNLVDAAQAAYTGFAPGTFYDLGRVTDPIQLFPSDLGRVTDVA